MQICGENARGGGRAGEGERDMLLNKYMYRGLNVFLYMCIPSKCKFRKKFIKKKYCIFEVSVNKKYE